MRKFETVEAVAAAMDMANVDTDQIIPARFLWRARAEGYGALLFNDIRSEADGSARPDFVLNLPASAGAGVLVLCECVGEVGARRGGLSTCPQQA